MSFVSQILGKSINNLTFTDIQTFFEEGKAETDRLEFKSYNANNHDEHIKAENTVIEAISSFLNSAGGLIIWGAPKGEKSEFDKKIKIFKGALSPVNKEIDKDSFARRVASLITPTPTNVRFHPLRDLNSAQPSFIYLIEVEQSPYSPHQFDGKVYKMRLDGSNHNAPHHYLEALFKKISYPNLTGSILYQHCTQVNPDITRIMFIIRIKNMTPYQNEEAVYLNVNHSNALRHSYGLRMLPGLTHNKENDSFSHHSVTPLLFFGESLEAHLFLDYGVATRNMLQTVVMSFGGKKSPLKRTTLEFRWYPNEFLYPQVIEQSYITDQLITEGIS